MLEREKVERFRLGTATASLMTVLRKRQGARNWWHASDVFGDLDKPDDREQSEEQMEAVLMTFPGARRVRHEA